jgi:hypothetical protein
MFQHEGREFQSGRELPCESIEVLPTAHSLSRNDPIMTAFRQRMTDRHANVESRTEHVDDLCRWLGRGAGRIEC